MSLDILQESGRQVIRGFYCIAATTQAPAAKSIDKGQTIRIYFNTHQTGNGLLTYMNIADVTVSVKQVHVLSTPRCPR